ncbi:MAG: molybdenum cofactor guanylyltransferase [Firmicutes bacterium]|nr:molybdenum cofactor guanylyltransferase [Bacillota bacterium]
MQENQYFAAILLNGGQSQRLGMDKSGLTLDGLPLAAENFQRWQGLFADIIIVGKEIPLPESAVTVQDIFPGSGPLAGVHAGLTASRRPYNLAVACDMPLIPRDLIRRLLREALQSRAEIVACRSAGGKIQPVCAVYAQSCRDKAADLLRRGKRSLMALFDICQCRYVDTAQELFNINTPADAARFAALHPQRRLNYPPDAEGLDETAEKKTE